MPGSPDHEQIPEPVPPLPLPEFGYNEIEKSERIGTGGDADVYLGTVEHQGYTYQAAIKEPRFEGTIQRRVAEKFQNEAETWSNLNDHENIVSVYARGAKPLPWIGLEYMDGGTLGDKIGSLDVGQALWLAGRIAEGIRYGHRHGVAHLDIKPTNVLLRDTGSGTWDYPKVSDWGLAKMLLEHSNSVEGISPTYAAPEQFDSETYGSPDDFTDIYQLGTVVYAMVAGEPPFTGASTAVMRSVLDGQPDPPSTVNPNLPEGVDEVVLNSLAKKKDDRYESVVLFRKELDRLFAEIIKSGSAAAVGVGQAAETTSSEGRTGGDEKGESGRVPRLNDNASLSVSGASSPKTQSAAQEPSEGNDSSLVSRRSALGAIGVGVVGSGGLLLSQMGSDSTNGESDSDTPATDPSSEFIFDFEDSSNFDWQILAGSRENISFSNDSVRGSQSLYFEDTEEKSTSIKKEFDNRYQIESFSFWYKYNSEFDNNWRFNILNANGDPMVQFWNWAEQVNWSYPNSGTTVANISQDAWYQVIVTDLDYISNVGSVVVKNTSGDRIGGDTNLNFHHNSDSAKSIIIIDALGYDEDADPLWIDNIVIGER